MSKKHFNNYFNSVAENYKEMLETLHELEEECNKGLVDPDKVNQMEELIAPLKNNYMTLSWVMYLLNQPNREIKKKKYERVALPQMNKIDPNRERSPEAIIKENKQTIDNLKITFNIE